MHTLITAANSAGAYRLKTKLNDPGILLGDYMDLPEIMLTNGSMLQLPDPKTSSYTHQMLALCLDHDITIVYALREPEQQLLQEAIQLFEEYNITLMLRENENHQYTLS